MSKKLPSSVEGRGGGVWGLGSSTYSQIVGRWWLYAFL